MILDDNSKFGLRALTRAIGTLEATPTQTRARYWYSTHPTSAPSRVTIARQPTSAW